MYNCSSPIFYKAVIDEILALAKIISIELMDNVKNIFNRMVFADDCDVVYDDDKYKNKHKKHYLEEIRKDRLCFTNEYKEVIKFNVGRI